jgi:hypothetical protein
VAVEYVKANASFQEVIFLAGRVVSDGTCRFRCKTHYRNDYGKVVLIPIDLSEKVAPGVNGAYPPGPTLGELEDQGWTRLDEE